MKLIRLSTGEEVITKIKEEDECTVTIEDGIMLIPAGEGKIGMVPFMPYSDGSPITISRNHIMFMAVPNDDLQRQVTQLTSGIQLPSSNISSIIT